MSDAKPRQPLPVKKPLRPTKTLTDLPPQELRDQPETVKGGRGTTGRWGPLEVGSEE